MKSFLDFRSQALQSLTLLPNKQRKKMSKEETERWIKEEYERHNSTKEDLC